MCPDLEKLASSHSCPRTQNVPGYPGNLCGNLGTRYPGTGTVMYIAIMRYYLTSVHNIPVLSNRRTDEQTCLPYYSVALYTTVYKASKILYCCTDNPVKAL